MNWLRYLQGLGVLSIGGGSVAVGYAFQRQMCTMVGFTSSCIPNIVYLIPGLLAIFIGIFLFGFVVRRSSATTPPHR